MKRYPAWPAAVDSLRAAWPNVTDRSVTYPTGSAAMPRIVDRQEKRNELVHAALSVFAERGYHRATMQSVAERAGVSKGSVYDYFESKEELLVFTAETMLGSLVEASIVALEQSTGPIRRRLETLVRGVLDHVDEWTDVSLSILQVWAEMVPNKDQPLRALMADMYSRSADRIAAVLDESVSSGEALAFPTRAAALAIIAALDGTMLQAIIVEKEFRAGLSSDLLPRWCAAIVPLADATGDHG